MLHLYIYFITHPYFPVVHMFRGCVRCFVRMLHHVICASVKLQADSNLVFPYLVDLFIVPADFQHKECVISLYLVNFDLVNK
jgi:hypothetical protein